MNRLFPLLILLCLCLSCTKAFEQIKEREKTASADRAKLKDAVLASIKMKKKWGALRFEKVEDNAMTLYLEYTDMPRSNAEIETDTKEIAKAVLQVLRNSGKDPMKSWYALFVHAVRRETGASGGPVVRSFGKVMYDFSNDSLVFTPSR